MSMNGYKGFEKDWTCINQRYAIGETVTVEGKLELCNNGIHYCKNPLGVFAFYEPCNSRFALIEASDEHLEESDLGYTCTKCCARSITVVRELDAWDMVFLAEGHMAAYSTGKEQKIHTEDYCNGRTSVTYMNSPNCYWVSNDTMVLATEMWSCARNTCGAISITLAPLSIALLERGWEGLALAYGSQSAARAKSSGALAVTLGSCSVSIAEGDNSVAFVSAINSLAVVKGDNSVGMATFKASKVLLEGSGCIALVHGDVEVRGKGCVVMLIKGYKKTATIKAVAGTRLLIPFLDTMTYNEIICGEADDWPAGVARRYIDIMEDFLKNV